MIPETLASLDLSPAHAENLSRFVELFEKWNRSINLSAARTRPELVEHVVDSLHVVPHLPAAGRVLDVGSGGGLPVVIAAICAPGVAFTSIEPVHKKHAFLRTATRELGLVNLTASAERLEDHVPRDYDAAMSRATFDLAEWLAAGSEHVRAGGIVIGFEATARADVIDAERHPYALGDKTRAIVIRRVTGP